MRKLVVTTFVSLDGVMQGPGGPDEDRDGGFGHGGWVAPFVPELLAGSDDETTALSALLLGRRTYQGFAEAWPQVGDENPVAARFNRVPKYVVSRTLDRADWAGSTIIRDDAAGAVAALKDDGEGEIQVHGSAGLIQTLLRHDLVDEFMIKTFPVLLGSGKRLFGDGTLPGGLTLAETSATTGGVMISRYVRDGELRTGHYAAESDQ